MSDVKPVADEGRGGEVEDQKTSLEDPHGRNRQSAETIALSADIEDRHKKRRSNDPDRV